MKARWRRVRRKLLAVFERLERPAAWGLLIGGFVSFVSVLFGLIVVGEARLATLLIAADLTVAGFAAVQASDDDDEDE